MGNRLHRPQPPQTRPRVDSVRRAATSDLTSQRGGTKSVPPLPQHRQSRAKHSRRNYMDRLLEDKVARAEVIDVSKLSGDTIKFGATVTLIDEDTGEKKVWQIVGEPEADAKKRKISVTSPIARALIGKTKGANVEVEAPGGAKANKIRRVQWPEDSLRNRERSRK